MQEEYENIKIDNTNKTPKYFESKLNELDQRYNLIMNELSDNYKNNKDIHTDEKNIEKLQNEFFLLKNMILGSIEIVSKNINQYDSKISKLLKENDKLKKRYDEMKQNKGGSKGFASDTQVLYNQYYTGNVLIGLVTLSSIFFIQKYFTSETL
jgi:hypothetical protein